MKKILKKGIKLFLIVLYPFVLFGLVFFGFLYLTKNNEINEAQAEYKKIQKTYEVEASTDTSLVKSLKSLTQEIEKRNKKIDELELQIEELKTKIESSEKTGLGLIQGSILPFVTNQNGLRQYQMVCAELVDNSNKQYCVSVSAIQKKYSLNLPEGDYYVFATVLNNPEYTEKAYYTEFVVCSNSEENKTCSEKLRDNKVVIKVQADKKVENVDPVDWSLTKTRD